MCWCGPPARTWNIAPGWTSPLVVALCHAEAEVNGRQPVMIPFPFLRKLHLISLDFEGFTPVKSRKLAVTAVVDPAADSRFAGNPLQLDSQWFTRPGQPYRIPDGIIPTPCPSTRADDGGFFLSPAGKLVVIGPKPIVEAWNPQQWVNLASFLLGCLPTCFGVFLY